MVAEICCRENCQKLKNLWNNAKWSLFSDPVTYFKYCCYIIYLHRQCDVWYFSKLWLFYELLMLVYCFIFGFILVCTSIAMVIIYICILGSHKVKGILGVLSPDLEGNTSRLWYFPGMLYHTTKTSGICTSFQASWQTGVIKFGDLMKMGTSCFFHCMTFPRVSCTQILGSLAPVLQEWEKKSS